MALTMTKLSAQKEDSIHNEIFQILECEWSSNNFKRFPMLKFMGQLIIEFPKLALVAHL